MKSYLKLGVIFLGIACFLTSCENDNLSSEDFIDFEVTENDKAKITEMGYSALGLRIMGLKHNDVIIEKYYMIDGEDIMMSSTGVDKTLGLKGKKDYAYNVGNNQTINVENSNQAPGTLSNSKEDVRNNLSRLE